MSRKILIVLLFLFGAPILLAIFMAIASFGFGIVTMGALFTAVSVGDKPEPIKSDWNIVNLQDSNRLDFKALVNRHEFSRPRIAHIQSFLSFDEIRGNDPTGVDHSERENYALSSGPRLAQQECEILVATIASKCVVDQANIRLDNQTQVYSIMLRLMYVEKAEFGDVAKPDGVSLVSSNVRLNRNGASNVRTDRRGFARLRRELYTNAAAECRLKRTKIGNCAIHNITINSHYDRTSQMITATAGAKTVMLQAQTVTTAAAK